jgi:hypothetical protein
MFKGKSVLRGESVDVGVDVLIWSCFSFNERVEGAGVSLNLLTDRAGSLKPIHF